MGNSIENEIFKRIDDLRRQFEKLKEKTERSLDNNSIIYRLVTKIEKRVVHMEVIVRRILTRVDRVLKSFDKEKD